jgi:hypothetical protein
LPNVFSECDEEFYVSSNYSHTQEEFMKKQNNKKSDYSMAHVLYQKLGNNWFAFTEVNGECFMAKVDEEFVQNKISEDPEATKSIPVELLRRYAA